MDKVLLGLIAGIAFGFVIQRVGATNSDKMAKAHLMIESQIPQFMLLAVIFAAIGVFGLKLAGIGRFMPLPTSIVATGLAAILFGVGWGMTGYCPGTCWAAAGEGRYPILQLAQLVGDVVPGPEAHREGPMALLGVVSSIDTAITGLIVNRGYDLNRFSGSFRQGSPGKDRPWCAR